MAVSDPDLLGGAWRAQAGAGAGAFLALAQLPGEDTLQAKNS